MIKDVPASSPLIDEKLKSDLSGIFQRLEDAVTIKAVIDTSTEKGNELAGFLSVIASLREKITLEMYAPQESECPQELDTQWLPASGLYKDGQYCGIAFHGVPGGQEINSFVLAIYNLSGPGQKLDMWTKRRIRKLIKKANIKVCVSLACHHCPKVVTAAQQIAALNDNIEAEMIDAGLYPDLVEKYEIERVPVIIIDDNQKYIGAKTIDELMDLVK